MSQQVFQTIVYVAALLFAVSFHESAHAWVAMKCGDNTARDLGRITLNPIKHIDPIGSLLVPLVLAIAGAPVFGWARPVPISLRGVRDPRRANLLISAAGPASNLILATFFAVVVFALRPTVTRDSPLVPLLMLAVISVVVNVTLAVFNFIPIPPLDGFGVLESLLPGHLAGVAFWLRQFGFLILFVSIATGVLNHVLGPPRDLLLNWLLGRSF